MEPWAQRSVNPGLQKSLAFLAKAEQLRQARQYQEAVQAYQQAMKLFPMNARAYRGLMVLLLDLRDVANAVKVSRMVPPALYEQSAELRNIRALVLLEQGEYQQAISILQSLEHVPGIDKPALYNNLGTCYNRQEMFDPALAYYQKAYQAGLRVPVLYRDLAGIYQKQADIVRAEAHYREGLKRFPEDSDLLYEYSILLLKNERFREGFQKYAARWQSTVFNNKAPEVPIPRWDGKARVKSLLVLAEQAVGDQVVLSALLPALRGRAEQITAGLGSRLHPLLRRSFPDFLLPPPDLTAARIKETHDAYVFAGDLGALFPDEINWEKGWLLPDPEKTGALRAKYQKMFPGKKLIGLTWKSRRPVYGEMKSIGILEWKPLLETAGCQFISLQYGDVAEDLRIAREQLGIAIHLDPEIDSFNDLDGLAAQANALDLLITTSNTSAHLAAATNAPTWVLLPMGAGLLWYWGYGEKSRWYPHVRLFRTADAQDWTPVIGAVAGALGEHLQ